MIATTGQEKLDLLEEKQKDLPKWWSFCLYINIFLCISNWMYYKEFTLNTIAQVIPT
ncbi:MULTISPECIES: cbb3-type cytochrome c oxidase N-terminal domain-containing protein [Bacillus cereus group]|uniref:cbb3-type cytochrome c oxidase N-terminal domain-containing protein n=1 Tax=Bacillus cereus group TaxID=86661 RepID=UPI0012F775CE|nr:hypothetical protein [Bacillus cereus]MCC2449649.1 hypothetical protein [Bacillus cereus]MCC2490179.1 hypothetical protein [Bacillus cereus]MCC2511150.1 hypothetical protein [Bacillus cereus]HDR4447482.1 hypothetical protein [Bacillus cereus]